MKSFKYLLINIQILVIVKSIFTKRMIKKGKFKRM